MTINNAPRIMPMISSTPRVRETTAPASCCCGNVAKAAGATTKLKKTIAPSHKLKIASLIFCDFIVCPEAEPLGERGLDLADSRPRRKIARSDQRNPECRGAECFLGALRACSARGGKRSKRPSDFRVENDEGPPPIGSSHAATRAQRLRTPARFPPRLRGSRKIARR